MGFIEKYKKSMHSIKSIINFLANYSKFGWRPYYVSDLSKVVTNYAEKKDEVFFLQIGSNDGVANDPIAEHIKLKDWKGLLVEPIKYLFKKLQKTHEGNIKLTLVNAAIAPVNGTSIIYKIDEQYLNELPSWCNQLASFRKEVIESHEKQVPGISNKISEECVNTYNIDTLIEKYQIGNINLIHIDTEGYDYQILKLINFNKTKPDIVLYENKHLSLEEYKSSVELLKVNNYKCISDGYDTLAIHKSKLAYLSTIKLKPFYERTIN